MVVFKTDTAIHIIIEGSKTASNGFKYQFTSRKQLTDPQFIMRMAVPPSDDAGPVELRFPGLLL
jgi:hypothetical protein